MAMAMAQQQQQQVALKIAFNGDIHRTRVDLRGFSLAELTQLMAQTFRLPVGDFLVQYRDPEGDCVNVTTDAEFQEAVRVFLGARESVPSLKFAAVTRRQAEFQEQVADPLVKSVEQLMRALAVTLEQLKSDAQFASSPAPAVALDQAARDSAESPKAAASGFSSFAQGLVGQINRFIPEKKAGEATAAPVAVPVAPEPESKPEVQQQQQQPQPAAAAPVEEAPPAQETTEETPSIASSVAFSEAEVKWAEQLSVVSGIFPNANPARVIDILEKSDGNLNVVLNVLTEEN
ncbi:Ubiquitin system component Cue [Phytophthora cinnamomi]|uniref:Ubiquitin system component Cue n=1 Tax=Phytophthora cinnamomi TaxID=4785 RepID=UPI00355ACAE9|nr:Ubiquitin system component Cue [Phytophthora cinnamomi]